MKRILFLIHDLGQGGAEKVLVSLVNNMDRNLFDISVTSMFGGGVNEKLLSPDIKYRAVFKKSFPGNSKIMKLFSPKTLFGFFVKEEYDIIVSYLEGPSARIVSGCDRDGVKLVSWIHSEQRTLKNACASFRSEKESHDCYSKFDMNICVSETVKKDFISLFHVKNPVNVLYNTVESDKIRRLSEESISDVAFSADEFKITAVGTLKPVKGFDRLARIHKKLKDEGYPVHTYVLGKGPMKAELEEYAKKNGMEDSFTLLGYHTNPYKYVSKCDLFVCSSHSEGFSTAASEALIVGTPVCSVKVSGMEEMLGASGEFGVICENDEESLYKALKSFADSPEKLSEYKKRAVFRGGDFSTEKTVEAVSEMFASL